MFKTLPKDHRIFMEWNWKKLEPYADDLSKRQLTQANVDEWVMDWSDINRVVSEIFARLWVATTRDTSNPEFKMRFNTFLDETLTPSLVANQAYKEMLLKSGLKPKGFKIPLLNMQVEAEIYRDENLPLLTEEKKLVNEYDEIIGAQTVEWEGQEVTTTQLMPVYLSPDRSRREKAWRLSMERRQADRQRLNDLWVTMLDLRGKIARNAGFDDYRAYRWKDLHRFDYTPDDCTTFHNAIEAVAVPASQRIYEKRRGRLGLSSLRPWDLDVDPFNREALKPYETIEELVDRVSVIFHRVDDELGKYFDIMRTNELLDLENRKGKAPGAYCSDYDMVMLPFIFENAVGLHGDVATLIHEGGHAFHVFEEAHLPYYHQLSVGMEFAEVASTSMELLASPYLLASEGGFYTEKDAARARIEHLEEMVTFLPYMAVVDAFQHWAYTHEQAAANPDNCDQEWARLWGRFMIGIDWRGLDEIMVTGWLRKQHIFEVPFYYIEYGLASMGALQVWRNALTDQKQAVAAYRRALRLGGTVPIPELYLTAGAHFAFDAETLGEVIGLAEAKIEEFERV
ncbi:MAG: M3 family oligoendopeptidase [Anaerolineales bacterium]|nr:M3 family oligoendopeptidase [Anaerolineae bacterium]PWB55851.1 MAG: M3 family oligoendopeptidase [Anaerolineales bacterium]